MAPPEHAKKRFIARRIAASTASGLLDPSDPALVMRFGALWERGAKLGLEIAGDDVDDTWQLVAFHDPAPWFGGGATIVFADRERCSKSALEALVEAIARAGLHQRADVWLEIDPRDAALRRRLADFGLGVDTVISVGAIDVARRAAPDVLGRAGWPDGLSARPLRRNDIEAVVELHRETFTREPEWCWFGAMPLHLQVLAESLEGACASRDRSGWHQVLEVDGRIVGHIDVDDEVQPGFGRSAGVGLILAAAWRGRGLLKPIWRSVIDTCHQRGIRYWRGGTSQPAVLATGARLGRSWHQLGMRRNAPLPWSHFAPWAPSDGA
jgi:GNAT superfamily N-acetyltransferase